MGIGAGVEQLDIDSAVHGLDQDGYAVIPGVLSADEVARVTDRLWAARDESERRGVSTYMSTLDPNASNVRVFNLIDLDPVFGELIAHPAADALAKAVLGEDYIVSNFTANIARPGSGSMMIHSDQSLVAPEPWTTAWALNIIWVLCDLRQENGATLHVPGSQRYATRAELPADLADQMVPFEAPAGSILAMEGRVWHTSGSNVTKDEDRPLLFGYYSRSFVRPQWNHSVALRPEVQQTFDEDMRYRLGLDAALNVRGHG